jgi:uncharacterized Zn-binding protein involved in type VI secretion
MSPRTGHALQAAGIGHRITHEDDLPEAVEFAKRSLAHAERNLESGRRTDPKLALAIGAALAMLNKVTTGTADGDDKTEEQECPDPCGAIEKGSENTFMGRERRGVALVGGEGTPCEDHDDDPIREGSANVWVNGKRIARRSDETECGAQIGEGEHTVWIGAETAKQGERTIGDKVEQFLQAMIGDLISGKRDGGTLAAQHLADALGGSKLAGSKNVGRGASGAALGDQLASGGSLKP